MRWTNLAGLLLAALMILSGSAHAEQPNIVIVMADDLGYGDVQPLNPDSTIATPAFNRLAAEGVTFTDAHSPSGVCTPTRYGLVCGRYAWRTRMKRGVLAGYSKPLIDADQQTIGTVLQQAGYRTACVGKWHLGLGWQWRDEPPENINFMGIAGQPGSVAYDQPILDGPLTHGFDECFIIPASLDMSPYTYLRDDRVTAIPDAVIEAESFPRFYRKGELAPDFEIVDVLERLTEEAVERIDRLAESDQPYLLYFPLSAPHKPVYPKPEFEGKSERGPYGDFVMQVDAALGRVIDAIEASGEAENTILVVTSDNGSFMNRIDDAERPDHVAQAGIQGYHPRHHRANGNWRGTKADIWEGGHRVPFFVRFGDRRQAGQRIDQTICHVDLLATCADWAGTRFDPAASPDSFSWASLLSPSSDGWERPPVIHHSANGMFSIREGKWKLVLGNGSGGRQKPQGKPFEEPWNLFDLEQDPAETVNLIEQNPEIRERLSARFEEIAAGDHNQ